MDGSEATLSRDDLDSDVNFEPLSLDARQMRAALKRIEADPERYPKEWRMVFREWLRMLEGT